MKHSLIALTVFASFFLGLTPKAVANDVVALVMGNSGYNSTTPLHSPRNDANELKDILENKGIAVTHAVDLDRQRMRSKIDGFLASAINAKLVLIYYAGHVFQKNGINYLLPVDAAPMMNIEHRSINLNKLVLRATGAGRRAFIFVDSGFRNPLVSLVTQNFGKAAGLIQQGLAPLKMPKGSLLTHISYRGTTARQIEQRNSLFSKALHKNVRANASGSPIEILADRVRRDVYVQTRGRQLARIAHRVKLNSVYLVNPNPTAGMGVAGLGTFTTAGTSSKSNASKKTIIASLGPLSFMTGSKTPTGDGPVSLGDEKVEIPGQQKPTGQKTGQNKKTRMASFTPPTATDARPNLSPRPNDLTGKELDKAVQKELIRTKCLRGRADGKWGAKSTKALNKLSRKSSVKLASNQPSNELLRQLRSLNIFCARPDNKLKSKTVRRTPSTKNKANTKSRRRASIDRKSNARGTSKPRSKAKKRNTRSASKSKRKSKPAPRKTKRKFVPQPSIGIGAGGISF